MVFARKVTPELVAALHLLLSGPLRTVTPKLKTLLGQWPVFSSQRTVIPKLNSSKWLLLIIFALLETRNLRKTSVFLTLNVILLVVIRKFLKIGAGHGLLVTVLMATRNVRKMPSY